MAKVSRLAYRTLLERLDSIWPNPEATWQAMDARVTAAIEERVPLESAPIRLATGSHVLGLRIPNSTDKPHCVRYQGHVYFPSRRERSRYDMDVRVIRELVMRTSSQVERSQQRLEEAFERPVAAGQAPYLHVGAIPVFWRELLFDLKIPVCRHAVAAV